MLLVGGLRWWILWVAWFCVLCVVAKFQFASVGLLLLIVDVGSGLVVGWCCGLLRRRLFWRVLCFVRLVTRVVFRCLSYSVNFVVGLNLFRAFSICLVWFGVY